MKFPLRSHTFCVLGVLYLAACSLPLAARTAHDDSEAAVLPGQPFDDAATPAQPPETIIIPGPMRAFLRMAGIGQEITTEEVLPTLARNAAL